MVIYARYSTDLQTFKSIEDQISLCRDFAARHGWIVVEVYFDAERSGTTLVGREGFFRMMACGRARRVRPRPDRRPRPPQPQRRRHPLHGPGFPGPQHRRLHRRRRPRQSDLEVAFWRRAQNAEYAKRRLAAKTRRGQEGTVKSGRISGSASYGYKKVYKEDGKNGYREVDCRRTGRGGPGRIFKDYVRGPQHASTSAALLNAEGVPGSPRQGLAPRRADRNQGRQCRPSCAIASTPASSTGAAPAASASARRGTIKVKATEEGTRLVQTFLLLRIVDDELFQAAQARLRRPRRVGSLFNDAPPGRVPLLPQGRLRRLRRAHGHHEQAPGLHLARASKGTCDNGRRVPREDLEEAVLASPRTTSLLPELIGPRLEAVPPGTDPGAGRAPAEGRSRPGPHARAGPPHRQARQPASARRGLSTTRPTGQLMKQEVNRSGRAQALRAGRRPDQGTAPSPTSPLRAITQRLRDFVQDLRTCLAGDEREAVRAKDPILRAMIDKIVVTPIRAGEGGQAAAPAPCASPSMGCSLTQMLDLADAHAGRAILHGSCPGPCWTARPRGFRYWVDLEHEDPRHAGQGCADVATIARLLDVGDVPVTKQRMLQALAGGVLPEVAQAIEPYELRVREAVTYLKTLASSPAPSCSAPERTGWVWNHYRLTDEEWRERARRT